MRTQALKRLPLVTLPLVAATLLAGCRFSGSADPWRSSAQAIDSLHVDTPCAERIILRSSSAAMRHLGLSAGAQTTTVRIRGRDRDLALEFSSLVRALPMGGDTGYVSERGNRIRFDSRGKPPCVGPLPVGAQLDAPDDYKLWNSERSRDGSGAFPGLVAIGWRHPLQRATVDSLLLALRASVIEIKEAGPGAATWCLLWFDGDDESAQLALTRVEMLRRSSAVAVASVVPISE